MHRSLLSPSIHHDLQEAFLKVSAAPPNNFPNFDPLDSTDRHWPQDKIEAPIGQYPSTIKSLADRSKSAKHDLHSSTMRFTKAPSVGRISANNLRANWASAPVAQIPKSEGAVSQDTISGISQCDQGVGRHEEIGEITRI